MKNSTLSKLIALSLSLLMVSTFAVRNNPQVLAESVLSNTNEKVLEKNYALNKNVEYSGVEGGKVGDTWRHPHLAGESVVDGNFSTRWSAEKKDLQWLTVDLGEEIELGKILIHFHSTSPDYEIEISKDNVNFKSIVHEVGKNGERITMTYDLTGHTARYVKYKQNKMLLHNNGKNYGSSIFIFEVYDSNAFKDIENTNSNDKLIVGSFNIASGLNLDIFEQSKQAHKHNIELLGLQEVDKYADRTRYDLLNSFSALRFPHHYFSKSIDFQNGEYGIGVVSKHEILESENDMFPPYSTYEDRSYHRVLINKGGREIALYNTHLSFENPYVRLRQMEILKERMMNDPAEYVIATGDFNVANGVHEYYFFYDEFNLVNGHNGEWFDTFNGGQADQKMRAIDNIIVSRNFKINNVGVDTEKLSDHFLIYAELEFLDEKVVSTEYYNIVLEETKDIDRSIYTTNSLKKFDTAISEINSEVQKDTLTQDQINAFIKDLKELKQVLVRKDGISDTESYDKLNDLVEEYKNIDLSIYTSISVKRFQEALDSAISVLEDDTLNNEIYQKHLDNLIDAFNQLTVLDSTLDFDSLKDAIDRAKKIDKSLYTEATLNRLNEAIKNAEKIILEAKEQSEIDESYEFLKSALDALEKKSNIVGDNTDDVVLPATGVGISVTTLLGLIGILLGFTLQITPYSVKKMKKKGL